MKQTHRAAQVLAESVSRLLAADTYKQALKFKKSFHNYSFRNAWLIYCQNPEATLVAGYQAWKKLGRQVRKGEKSIAICAPIIKKDDAGQPEVVGFRSASVFDLSQTDGEPLLETPKPELLAAEGSMISLYIQTLTRFLEAEGFTVGLESLSSAYGLVNITQKRVVIAKGLPSLQHLKTLIHEAAHALMHQQKQERHIGELEAESVAFLVCDALGLDTSRYSFPYLAHWADDPSELLPAAKRACDTAEQLLDVLALPDETLLAVV